MDAERPRIGTAGWAIPRAVAETFPAEGSALQRYAARFCCAEINSCFYRPHRAETYQRWAAAVPPEFRFAVKAPKAVTHEARLVGVHDGMARFLDETAALGARRGPVLVQLPPSLACEASIAGTFFEALRGLFEGPVALEPRHPSWFEPAVERLLIDHRIARVAADPVSHPAAAVPGGWEGLRYWRLHGSPRKYFSSYADGRLEVLAAALADTPGESWCIFDNTASGAAAADALALQRLLTAP